MQPGAEAILKKQPKPVRTIEVLWPEARRVGSEVDEHRLAIRADDFEREGVPWLRQLLPRQSDPSSEFGRLHAGAYTSYQP